LIQLYYLQTEFIFYFTLFTPDAEPCLSLQLTPPTQAERQRGPASAYFALAIVLGFVMIQV